jgi:hypothetical protein
MSKSNVFENELLLTLFNNANMALVGDATGLRGSSAAGSLYLSLHTADPGEVGTQATSEVAYTSYARVGVTRDGAGFTVTANAVALTANQDFPEGTGGSGTAAFWGIGTSASGAGKLLYKGALTPSIVCGTGVIPRIKSGTAIVTED